jgi:uroporphyrinogen decarboxylase
MKLADYFESLGRMSAVPVLAYPGLSIENVTTERCLLDPVLHTHVVRSNVQHYEPDAALPLLDLTVEAESFGIKPIFKGREAPHIRSYEPLDEVTREEKEPSPNRMSLMIEAARLISSQVENVPKGFFLTGPFTLAGQIIGIQELLMGLFKNPKAVLALIENCTVTVADYAKRLDDAGIDFLVIADPTPSLISPKQFEEFAKHPIARVVNSTSKEIILHICGRSSHLLQQMVETGVAALSLDNNVKLKDAVAAVPSNILIFGNYSPTDLLFKKPETIITEVKDMLSAVAGAHNVVPSTGCDVDAATPPENIQAFISTAKSYQK